MLQSCCTQNISGYRLDGLVTQTYTSFFHLSKTPIASATTSSTGIKLKWGRDLENVCERCVAQAKKEQVKLSMWISPWIPANRNSRPNPTFPISKLESSDVKVTPQLQGEAKHISTTKTTTQRREGRSFPFNFCLDVDSTVDFPQEPCMASQAHDNWEAAVACREKKRF